MHLLNNHNQALDMPGGEKGLDAKDCALVHPDRSSLTISLWVCYTILPFLCLGYLVVWVAKVGQFAGDTLLSPDLVYLASCVLMVVHHLPSFG